MKKYKNLVTRSLAMFLSLMLVVSLLPTTVFADDGDEAEKLGPNGGVIEDIEVENGTGTTETWNKTDEETGINKTGTETKTNTEIKTDIEDGTDVEVSDKRDLKETTTNPTVVYPDGSTMTTGSDYTEGNGSTTTTTTTVTEDPNNLPEAKDNKPKQEDIDAEAAKPENATQKTDGKFEDDDPEKKATELPDTTVSADKEVVNKVLEENDSTVTMNPDGKEVTNEIETNIGDWASVLNKKINAAHAGLTEYTPTKADQITLGENSTAYRNDETGEITVVTKKFADDGKTLIGYTTQTYGVNIADWDNKTDAADNGDITNITESEDGKIQTKDDERDTPEYVYEFEVPETDAVAGESRDKNGNLVKTTVTELYSTDYYLDNGDGTYTKVDKDTEGAEKILVGYQVDTETFDGSGKSIGNSSRSDWATQTETKTTRIYDEFTAKWNVVKEHYTVPVTRAVTTEDNTISMVVTDKDGNKLVITGTMTPVTKGEGHGTVGTGALVVDMGKEGVGDGKTNTTNDLYNRADGTGTATAINEDGHYVYLGEYGLESAIRVNGTNKTTGAFKTDGTWQPHQFLIRDKDGKEFYVYCADFEVSPKGDTKYHEDLIDGENTVGQWSNDADVNKNTAQHVQAIALNGYWGTASGTGSLENVKQMMKDAIDAKKITGITKADVDMLTDGMALTATQAAIWSFATSGQGINTTDPFGVYDLDGVYYTENTTGYVSSENRQVLCYKGEQTYFTAAEEQVALALYSYLRGMTPEPSYKKDEITITGSSINVKNLVGNEVKTGNNTYNTDVTFTLKTEPSQLNDDLMVYINGQGFRLAGNGGDKRVKDNGNGSYTIENVELEEGVTITLNLSGTQLADKSAYLITAEYATGTKVPNWDISNRSQTFVGVKEQIRDINLTVGLTFTVQEPQATMSQTTKTDGQSRTDEYKQEFEMDTTWQVSNWEEVITAESSFIYNSTTDWTRYTPAPEIPEEPDDDDDDDDDDEPELPDPETPLSEEPEEDDDVELDEPDIPLAEVPEEEVELDEPDIPLANVPQTGDESAKWYVMTALSAAGLVSLVVYEQKKRREDSEA